MKQAFTLIELLVVVLIIGILAAVAVPQYQVAVLKAKAVKGIIMLNAVEKAQLAYKMANGIYAKDGSQLTVETTGVQFPSNTNGFADVHIDENMSLEWVWPSQHRCIGYTHLGHQACKALGGVPFTHSNNTQTRQYYRLP